MSNDNRKTKGKRDPKPMSIPCNHQGCGYNKFGNCTHPAPVRSFDKCEMDNTPPRVFDPVQDSVDRMHELLAEEEGC